MFELFFIIPLIFVAGVWGYILLNFAGNSRRYLNDDIHCRNEKQRKEAKRTLRTIHLMAPVWVMVVASAIVFFVNAIHPFIKLSVAGVALTAGGLFFAYLGLAIGLCIRGPKDDPGDKDALFFSRIFMISFIGAGLLIAIFGIIISLAI